MQNVRPPRPQMMPHMPTSTKLSSIMPNPNLDDVKGQHDDVRGLQGPMSWWKGKTPPLGLGLPECLWGNVLLSSWCHPLVSLCPWLGSQHPSGGISAPWRSELIISPYVPVHRAWSCNNNKYALHGLISHRDHSNVNHIQ
jgi:hypothetical protein